MDQPITTHVDSISAAAHRLGRAMMVAAWFREHGPRDDISRLSSLLGLAVPLAHPRNAFVDVLSGHRWPMPPGGIQYGPPFEPEPYYEH